MRRSTYLAANAVITLLGPAVATLLAGVSLGLVAHSKDDTIAVIVLWQAAVTIPAVWVLVGLASRQSAQRPDAD